jgi:uncharacterized protein
MKFLLVIAVILFGVWLFRSGRHGKVTRQGPGSAAPQPQEMVSCKQCGLHFPRADALPGRNGLYCSAEHRKQAES